MAAPILILGPQRPTPNLRGHLDRIAGDGPVALITAGWRHDEDEIGPLVDHVGREVRHLRLYAEMERALAADRPLAAAYRARQRDVLRYKEVYRISLRAALTAVRDLRRHAHDAPDLYGPDLHDAFDALRRIDSRLLRRLDEIHQAHAEVERPFEASSVVAAARERLMGQLDGVAAVLIAGGHVAVLRNRLRFFGLHNEIARAPGRGVPLVAWSAGAMVLTERIILFYDDPPHGHGEAEVLARGFAIVPGVVLLPHARLRLDLADEERVALFAGRFLPSRCVALEPGVALELGPDGRFEDHSLPGSAFYLGLDGATHGGVGA